MCNQCVYVHRLDIGYVHICDIDAKPMLPMYIVCATILCDRNIYAQRMCNILIICELNLYFLTHICTTYDTILRQRRHICTMYVQYFNYMLVEFIFLNTYMHNL